MNIFPRLSVLQELAKAGTSEGVKRAWDTRHGGGGPATNAAVAGAGSYADEDWAQSGHKVSAPPAAEAAPIVQSPALPPPPSASAPRRQGASPPAAATTLQGRDPEAVISALGEPALRRREGNAEVWLYQAPDCRLDLVFYPEDARLVLAHAAARAHGTRRLTESACMATIARAPNTPPWTAPGSGGG
jgi:hypothetical protein